MEEVMEEEHNGKKCMVVDLKEVYDNGFTSAYIDESGYVRDKGTVSNGTNFGFEVNFLNWWLLKLNLHRPYDIKQLTSLFLMEYNTYYKNRRRINYDSARRYMSMF